MLRVSVLACRVGSLPPLRDRHFASSPLGGGIRAAGMWFAPFSRKSREGSSPPFVMKSNDEQTKVWVQGRDRSPSAPNEPGCSSSGPEGPNSRLPSRGHTWEPSCWSTRRRETTPRGPRRDPSDSDEAEERLRDIREQSGERLHISRGLASYDHKGRFDGPGSSDRLGQFIEAVLGHEIKDCWAYQTPHDVKRGTFTGFVRLPSRANWKDACRLINTTPGFTTHHPWGRPFRATTPRGEGALHLG